MDMQMMRTTLILPADLVADAMRITNISTKTELVKIALKNLIQKEEIKGIKEYAGKIDLHIDMAKMRQR